MEISCALCVGPYSFIFSLFGLFSRWHCNEQFVSQSLCFVNSLLFWLNSTVSCYTVTQQQSKHTTLTGFTHELWTLSCWTLSSQPHMFGFTKLTIKHMGDKKKKICPLLSVSCSAQVRLHVMCAHHPNIVQILEVYANSVQFPHESSPR